MIVKVLEYTLAEFDTSTANNVRYGWMYNFSTLLLDLDLGSMSSLIANFSVYYKLSFGQVVIILLPKISAKNHFYNIQVDSVTLIQGKGCPNLYPCQWLVS